MNKAQAAQDAGYSTTAVFKNPSVKAAIAQQLTIRAERLRVGADWVLMELKRVYDHCMNIPVKDSFGHTIEDLTTVDAANAIKALTQIGKHIDVKAFEMKPQENGSAELLVERLMSARQRVATPEPEEGIPVVEGPPVSFLEPVVAEVVPVTPVPWAAPVSDCVVEADELSSEEKLRQLHSPL